MPRRRRRRGRRGLCPAGGTWALVGVWRGGGRDRGRSRSIRRSSQGGIRWRRAKMAAVVVMAPAEVEVEVETEDKVGIATGKATRERIPDKRIMTRNSSAHFHPHLYRGLLNRAKDLEGEKIKTCIPYSATVGALCAR